MGVCFGSLGMVSGGAAVAGDAEGDNATGPDSPISFVLGAAGTLAAIGVVAVVAYVALRVVSGKFIQYTQFLSRPWYHRWLYPLGFWETPAQRLAYGYLLSPYRQGTGLGLFAALGFVSSLATAAVMLISPIPCIVRLSIVAAYYAATALLFAIVRPSRQPAMSAFAVVAQLLLAVTAATAAAQLQGPASVGLMHVKLSLVLINMLTVFARSLFSIVVRLLEHSRWSKFREQNTDEFAGDAELLRQNGSVQLEGFGMGMEEMIDLGIGAYEEGEGTQKKGSSLKGSGYAPPTLTASKKGKSKTTTPQLLPAVALIDEDDPILPFEVEEGTDDEGRDSASSLTTSRSGSNGGVQMKHRHRSAAGEDSSDLFADDSSDDDAESMVTIENDNASEFGSVAHSNSGGLNTTDDAEESSGPELSGGSSSGDFSDF